MSVWNFFERHKSIVKKLCADGNVTGTVTHSECKTDCSQRRRLIRVQAFMMKKTQIDKQKEQISAEDREKGIYFHAGVPNIPRAGKKAVIKK